MDEPIHLAKYNKYTTYEPHRIHSLHVVSFHILPPFNTSGAEQRWSYYSLSAAPSNVYDGHFRYTYSINEAEINASGVRQVHMLKMHLSKTIVGSNLSFWGNITNIDSHSFNGFVLVFIIENQLVDPDYPDVTWNFVFRGYGLNKTISLGASSTDTFEGVWSIPIYVNPANVQVIAAAFDANERDTTHGWPYAVQSVCDICESSEAIPEFPNISVYLFIMGSTAIIIEANELILFKLKRASNSRKRCTQGTHNLWFAGY